MQKKIKKACRYEEKASTLRRQSIINALKTDCL